MTPTNSNTTAHLAAFLTILCWGTTFVSTKVLLQGFTPVQILLIRFCIGFAALYFLSAKSTCQLTQRQNVYLASAGFFGICLYYLLENIALTYTQASSVGVIMSVSPFFYCHFFVCPAKRKITFSSFLRRFLPGDCRDLFAKFFRRDDGGQSKRRFVGHICRCRLGFVFNPYERNRKVRLSDNIRHTKDFRIRNPLYAPSTIIRVMSELAKDF